MHGGTQTLHMLAACINVNTYFLVKGGLGLINFISYPNSILMQRTAQTTRLVDQRSYEMHELLFFMLCYMKGGADRMHNNAGKS